MTDPRDRQLAELLVDTCVGVQPGWQVLLVGTPPGRPLLEEIAQLLGERDAYALLRVSFDATFVPRPWIRAAPLERLATLNSVDRHAIESCDALIVIDAPENTRDAAERRLRADRGAPGRVPPCDGADLPPRAAVGRLPVPDAGSRPGRGHGDARVRRLPLRSVPPRLGRRARANAALRRPLRRRGGGAHRRRGHRPHALDRGPRR